MPHGTTRHGGAISSRRIGRLPQLCRTFVHDARFRSMSSSRFSRSVEAYARQSEAKRPNYPASRVTASHLSTRIPAPPTLIVNVANCLESLNDGLVIQDGMKLAERARGIG
jgi:hypothetical protein